MSPIVIDLRFKGSLGTKEVTRKTVINYSILAVAVAIFTMPNFFGTLSSEYYIMSTVFLLCLWTPENLFAGKNNGILAYWPLFRLLMDIFIILS